MKNIKSYENFTQNNIQEAFVDDGYGFKKYQAPGALQNLKRKTKNLLGIEDQGDRHKLQDIYKEIENPPYPNYLHSVRDLSTRYPILVCGLGVRNLSIDCDPKDPSIVWGNKKLDLKNLEDEGEKLYYFIKNYSTSDPGYYSR